MVGMRLEGRITNMSNGVISVFDASSSKYGLNSGLWSGLYDRYQDCVGDV